MPSVLKPQAVPSSEIALFGQRSVHHLERELGVSPKISLVLLHHARPATCPRAGRRSGTETPKRPLLEAALALGQTEAGADACANLGVVQDVVGEVFGQVTQVRQSDEALGWAMTQDIASAASSGGSERAKTARCALPKSRRFYRNGPNKQKKAKKKRQKIGVTSMRHHSRE